MSAKSHWESIYERRSPDQVSWYQPHLERSLDFIRDTGLALDAAIIDVGGGEPSNSSCIVTAG